MDRIILATNNQGKIAELRTLLNPIKCIAQNELGITDAQENGLSFIENAILKARHASKIGNLPALADDSGIVVKALNGEPGIFSARFAGNNSTSQDNIKLLLAKLDSTPKHQRQAYFYCAIAVVQNWKDPIPQIATGKWEGEICMQPEGEQGFGYDPIFYVKDYQCTAAQLPSQIKNSISHRALALKKLKKLLK
jgi:XTP/dITP diphosphohydrolase